MPKRKFDPTRLGIRICMGFLIFISIWLFINFPKETIKIKTETGEIITGKIVHNYGLNFIVDWIWNVVLILTIIGLILYYMKGKVKSLNKHLDNFLAFTLQLLVVYFLVLALFSGAPLKRLFFFKLIITAFVIFLYSEEFIKN